MIKQILKDMYVSPELLSELSEDQRMLLFCKMREEQVRRYEEKEKEYEKQEKKIKKSIRKEKRPSIANQRRVDFLCGTDGNEWVWVMGEHADDLSIEQILENEAKEKATKEAEREAELKRQEEERELIRLQQEEQKLLEEKQRKEEDLRKKQEEAQYLSLKEAKKLAKKLEEEKKKIDKEGSKQLKEIKEKHDTVRRQTLERKKKLIARRSSELLGTFQRTRQMFNKLAEQDKENLDSLYKMREEQAKAEEERRRSLARTALEEHRKSTLKIKSTEVVALNRVVGTMSDLYQDALKLRQTQAAVNQNYVARKQATVEQLRTSARNPRRESEFETRSPGGRPLAVSATRPPQPPDKHAVIMWFKEQEAPKGVGLDPETGLISDWFHGVISRPDAEHLLASKPFGSFLVRVSERVWGYAVSVKGNEAIRHFLVDTSDGMYQFFGSNQIMFPSLHDLVVHHKLNPVSVMGGEKLLHPIGQQSHDLGDFQELFLSESTNL